MAPMQNVGVIRMSFFIPPSDICYRHFLARRPAALTEIFRGFSQAAKQMPDRISYRIITAFSPHLFLLFITYLPTVWRLRIYQFLKKTRIPDVAGKNIISLWRHLVLSVRCLTLVCCPNKWHQITGQEKCSVTGRVAQHLVGGSLAINVRAVQSSTWVSLLC